ncbi:hypothetical protein [Desertimonas flava]|uniref:hypothetical protein n=1 Tax=Desertimonas flava TaxID=2064846 RepID=UPI0013C4FA00|nr:hypothetical protein [Desertimonas flava]
MRQLRRSVLVGAVALGAAATASVAASPASAASTVGGCTTTLRVNAAGASEASVLCTQGSGTYRAIVVLPTFSLSSPSAFVPRTGPIVQVGQASTFAYAGGNIGGAPVRVLAAGPEILS